MNGITFVSWNFIQSINKMKKKIHLKLILFILYLIPIVNFAQTPNLGVASSFSLFTAVGAFNNTGTTNVTGDIGSNTYAITGFPPGIIIGAMHSLPDATTTQAALDVNAAYSYLSTLSGSVLGVSLGDGQILTAGIYNTGAASSLNGNLTLDGTGNPDALFIIKIGGAFVTSTHSTVTLINSASVCNVYWQIDGQFDLGDYSVFRGTVITDGAINLLEGSSLLGRGLSRAGAISLNNNIVTIEFQPTPSTISANGATTFCAGDNVLLSGNNGGIWSNEATTPTITVNTSGDYFVTNTTGCGNTTSNHILVSMHSFGEVTRTAIISTDWNIASTWSNNSVPLTCDNVVIDNDVNIIAGRNVACVDLTINPSKTLINNSGSFSISGILTNNGVFVHNNDTVIFNGTSIVGGSSINNFNNVIVSGTLTGHSTNMNIAGDWTNNGNFINNGGKITFNKNNINSPSQYGGLSTTIFKDVDILSGSSLKILSGKTMTVNGKLQILAVSENHMAQLVLEDNSSQVNGLYRTDSVFINVYDPLPVDTNNNTINSWHYISDPLKNDAAWIAFYGFFLKQYNENLKAYSTPNSFAKLEGGRGYAFKYNNSLIPKSPSNLITFKGPISNLNSGTIIYNITYTEAQGTGWNLVGNPYPSSIDWGYNITDATHTQNGWHCSANVEPTIYLYDGYNHRYGTYNSFTGTTSNNAIRYIPPMQGFYVHLTDTTINEIGKWSLDNRVRIAYDKPFWKGVEQVNTQLTNALSLNVSGNGYSDETVIGFIQNATKGFDGNYDAYKLFSPEKEVPQINTRTLDDREKVAVNDLPISLMNDVSIPLEFTVGIQGTYTITANNFNINSSIAITLEDMKTKKLTNLNTSNYTFSSDSVLNDNRFLVHFGTVPTSFNELIKNNDINIYSNHKQIIIQNNSTSFEKGSIIIYDILGKEIINRSLEPNSVTRIDLTDKNYSQAIFYVKVITNSQTITKKVLAK